MATNETSEPTRAEQARADAECYEQIASLVERYETAKAAYVADRDDPGLRDAYRAASDEVAEYRSALRMLDPRRAPGVDTGADGAATVGVPTVAATGKGN